MTDTYETPDDGRSEEPRRRSIRQIPIPENRRVRRASAPTHTAVPPRREIEEYSEDTEAEPEDREPEQRRERRVRDGHFARIGRRRSPVRTIVAVIALIAAAAFASTYFASAKVTVSAKRVSSSSELQLALENGTDYSVISTAIIERETVAATEEQDVERKASGTIVVYNDFDAEEQELIATTRFQTADGLVFRIPAGITVPGNSVQGDKTIPGKVETQVVADKAGSEYNIAATRFTVPGFQGTPRFTAFWAESTAPMTGGYVGTVKTVSDAERDAAVTRLRSKIEARIQTALAEAAGQGALVLSIPPKVTFSEAKVVEDGSNATIEVTATVVGYAIAESVLAAKVASANGAVVSTGTELHFAERPDIRASVDNQTINVVIDPTEVVWNVDSEAVRQALAGKNADEVVAVASGFAGIETIRADFAPGWASKFPTKAEKLTVSVE